MSEQIQAIKLLARDDLCHCYDTTAEVTRVTHYAGRIRTFGVDN